VLDDAYVVLRTSTSASPSTRPTASSSRSSAAPTSSACAASCARIDDLAKRAARQDHHRRPQRRDVLVTNPGIKGNLFGGAIINQPNVGILRMGEIQKRVVVVEGRTARTRSRSTR
jgi:2-oxoglutarate dehydrogenase E2 component (dihydrolipoamide succinyltransferase)